MKRLDRRIIFLFIFVGVIVPLMVPLGFRMETTENVRMVYNLVEQTAAARRDKTILVSFDYDPGSKPELHPMAWAVIHHALSHDMKILCVAMWPMGVKMCQDTFDSLDDDFPNLDYGVDWVNLGYKAGGMVTMQKMGKNLRDVFPTDITGIPVEELPIMKGIEKNFDGIAFVCSFSAGVPGIKEWVMVAHDDYDVPTTGGTTAVSAPSILPYVNQQQQLTGLLGGMKAAAEYELLIEQPGPATAGMDALSIAHLIIILFIVIANVTYHLDKKKQRG
ncbi:MAG: hypothetical protein K8R90_02875 [Candidatus Cloacimonetes bacterium]|nr:hypothetical protein [Candidatus Cloacimonadota bacterium]